MAKVKGRCAKNVMPECCGKLSSNTYRAGTNLTYKCKINDDLSQSNLDDICYIYLDQSNKQSYWEALSLETGFSTLGESIEDAYENLMLLLLIAMRDNLLNHAESAIGMRVSKKIIEDSKYGHRLNDRRQKEHLAKALKIFKGKIPKNRNLEVWITEDLKYKAKSKDLDKTKYHEIVFADIEKGEFDKIYYRIIA